MVEAVGPTEPASVDAEANAAALVRCALAGDLQPADSRCNLGPGTQVSSQHLKWRGHVLPGVPGTTVVRSPWTSGDLGASRVGWDES